MHQRYYIFIPTAENAKCNPNTWTGYDGSCCTVQSPCAVGEGDCDSNNQCKGDLVCGTDNCGHEFPSTADCCQGSEVNRN